MTKRLSEDPRAPNPKDIGKGDDKRSKRHRPEPTAPRTMIGALRSAEADLARAAKLLHAGRGPEFAELGDISIGRTPRGLSGGNHYLPANRLEWWSISEEGKIPDTNPIGRGTDLSSGDEAFHAEFCSPLSTVVGADLNLVAQYEPGTSISWDQLWDGWPLSIPTLEFRIRSSLPLEAILQEVEVDLGGGLRERRKVVVNGVWLGGTLDPTRPRSPLFIDFFAPQRAVGLECGFLGEEGRQIESKDVKLIARDASGHVIVESDGKKLFHDVWTANAVYHLIGVRDFAGGIRSVELKFDSGHDLILESPMVYRIWHEPFPHAAVSQGTVAVEFDPSPGGGNVLRVPYDGPVGPHTVRLPFHCDRAIVMMRGFKMYFLDQQPREVETIEASIGSDSGGDPRGYGVFATDPGGQITIVPSGKMLSAEREGYRVVIYYLVLAWNSADVEMLQFGCKWDGLFADVPDGQGTFVTSDLTPWPPPMGRKSNSPSASLQGFGFSCRRGAQEVELLGLQCGVEFGDTCLKYGAHYLSQRPSLLNLDGTVTWEFCTHLYGVDDSYRYAQGVILIGPDVKEEQHQRRPLFDLINDFEAVGPRHPGLPFHSFPPEISGGPVIADMAYLSLGQFLFEPKGKIRELEVEVHGSNYDGRSISWDVGFGISVSPPITGGGGGLSGGKRVAIGWPSFGGIVRRPIKLDCRVEVQELRFNHGIVGALQLQPDQYGAIRNVGNVPVVLLEAWREGLKPEEFNFLIEWDGAVFGEEEVEARGPLILYPGQSVVIGGRFFPQPERGSNPPAHAATLRFFASDRSSEIDVLATGIVIEADPHGTVVPGVLNFGQVSINPLDRPSGRGVKNALFISDGSTPFLIQTLTVEDPSLGFTILVRDVGETPESVVPGVRYQIQAGGSLTAEVHFDPPRPGPVETNLIAETNAGRLTVRLLGDGIA